jgi:hypothetical protein
MCFRGKDELKDAIERYALKMKVNIKYKRNEKKGLGLFVGGKVVLGFYMLPRTQGLIGFRL